MESNNLIFQILFFILNLGSFFLGSFLTWKFSSLEVVFLGSFLPWKFSFNFENLDKSLIYLELYFRNFQSVLENIMIIGDTSETHWRPTCMIIDQHFWSETDMADQSLIGVPSETSVHNHIPTSTCLIRDTSETEMVDQACPMGLLSSMSVSDESDQAYRSPMGLWSGISVSNQACWSPRGLRSDKSPIGLR